MPATQPTAVPAEHCSSMADVRREIDRIDRQLVQLIAERLTYIERAGYIKQDRSTVRDEARIQDVLNKVLAEAAQQGLPAKIAEPVWRAMMEACIAHEFVVYDARMAEPRRAAS